MLSARRPRKLDAMSGTPERIVTIFGGSKCSEVRSGICSRRGGSANSWLQAGFTICTGGYLGVMEAASRGAHERRRSRAGNRDESVQGSNPIAISLTKSLRHIFTTACNALITRSVGFIAIRGGMGTVTELSLVWNKIQTKVIDAASAGSAGRLLAARRESLASRIWLSATTMLRPWILRRHRKKQLQSLKRNLKE